MKKFKLEELLKINMGEQLQNYFKMTLMFKNLLQTRDTVKYIENIHINANGQIIINNKNLK